LLGLLLLDRKDLGEAIAELREAIRLLPEADSGVARLNLGHGLLNSGDLDAALPEYREAIRLLPDDPLPRATLTFELLMAGRPRGEIGQALSHARRAVELAPTNGLFASILAWAEYRTDHRAEAIAAAELAMGAPDGFMQANVWFILAAAHWQEGRRDEAAGWFDMAVTQAKRHDPGDQSARRLWAESAELLGRPGPDAAAPKT
jgi:tetratricopeptide (TPR) repeat protein